MKRKFYIASSVLLFSLFPISKSFSQTVNVTFQVDMSQQTNFTTPEVNGAFNNWCGNCNPMTDNNSDGIWEVTLPLPAGNYDYKFSADNFNTQETLTQGSPCTVSNFGFTNRNFTVGTSDIVLPVVCWGSCSSCAPAQTVNVTFQVDMSQQTGFTTPELNGTFNNWCGNCNPMTDNNSDGVWEVTIPLNPGPYEFKFSADNWTSQETLNQGDPCTVTNFGFTNRSLNLGSNDTTLAAVCWGTCGSCPQNVTPLDILVQVCDTNVQSVRMTGPFWGWGLTSGPLGTNMGNGQWKFTFNPPPAVNMEYLIVVDSVMENLINDVQNGGTCAPVTDYVNYANRLWTVGSGNVSIVYDRCVPCSYPDFIVTTEICGTPATSVRLTGPLWGWSNQFGPAGVDNGNGTWTITLSPAPKDTMVYLLVKDGTIENLIPAMASGGTCAPLTDFSTYANRQWVIGQGAVNVSYDQCTFCYTSISENPNHVFELYPNPVSDILTISSEKVNYVAVVTNLLGEKMMKVNSTGLSSIIDMSELSSGIYLVTLEGENFRQVYRVVKN